MNILGSMGDWKYAIRCLVFKMSRHGLCDLYACVAVAHIKRNIEGTKIGHFFLMMESLFKRI